MRLLATILIKHVFAMFAAFVLCEMSFIVIGALQVHSSDIPGEYFELIFLHASTDLVLSFCILYPFWLIVLKLAKIGINDRIILFWSIGIPIGVFIAFLKVTTSI